MSAEPFAACLACIPKMKKLNTPKMFREMGTKLTDGFKAAGKEHGFNLVVSGEPALFYLRIANDDNLMLHQEWIAECVSRGLFLASHHNHFMNAAVTDDDIKFALFGGDGEITDAMYEEVKQFAAFVRQREAEKKE